MPVVGLVRLSNVEVGVIVTSETVTDYLPRKEEWKLMKRVMLRDDTLESYKEAVLGSDMDISDSDV